VDAAAISTASQESATNSLIVTMHGMGGGMVEVLTGLDLKGGSTATVVFEIGISMTLISDDCAGNAYGITDMRGQKVTDTNTTTPTGPSKTRTGQTC
jgi:hypothetical protein